MLISGDTPGTVPSADHLNARLFLAFRACCHLESCEVQEFILVSHPEKPGFIIEIADINPVTQLVGIIDGYDMMTAKTIYINKFETRTATEDIDRSVRP